MTPKPDPDDLNQLLCFNIYALHRSFGRYYQAAFSQTGLTYTKFITLMVLDAHGSMSVSALSSHAGVEANTLSPLLKKMADFGAITRQRAKEDERRVDVELTPMGREILTRARAVISEGFTDLGLDEKRVKEVMTFLDDTRALVDQADPPKLSFDDLP